MRKVISLAIVLSMVLFSTGAYAATGTKASGGARTADVAIAQGLNIVGVQIVCGASACVSSIADTATLGGMTNGNTVWEGGAAASASAFFDYSKSPIVTTTGSTLNLDANTTAVIIYALAENP